MGPPPSAPQTPTGLSIQESGGEKGQSSTYELRDTLTCPHDEDLFDYYAASQLAFIDAASLATQLVGDVDRYSSLDAAPDGKHLLVTAIRKPYSYVTTYSRFPHDIAVWTVANCSKIATQPIASVPLADRVPVHGVSLGPRDISWRANAPATLIWAEALDGGDWKDSASARDKIMMSEAPFSMRKEIMRTQHRFYELEWMEHSNLALLTEYDLNTYWQRSFLVNVDEPQQPRRLLWDFSMDENMSIQATPFIVNFRTGLGSFVKTAIPSSSKASDHRPSAIGPF